MRMSGATTTLPCPRISAIGRLPRVFASELPCLLVVTSSPCVRQQSRISHIGTSSHMNEAMCEIAFNGSPVTLNGIMVGEWLCTTALTSGRAR